ncbi:MAG TPA: PhoH family protein [Candidatus Nitrosopolaris rasttigaisensis]|nr:PhoH family protein [Candidatus Nitrosopolaris rasttigaisensis]
MSRSHRPQPTYKTQKHTQHYHDIEIVPRNEAQEKYVDTLYDDNNSIVFAIGPAGTGKTMLATQFAIREFLEGNCKKIVITRPAVSVDEKLGFLPGDLIQKSRPWLIPIIDVFKEYFSVYAIEKMLKEETIEIAPLAYMRGRTFKNCIVIGDEMQNSTQSQMKMLLTRIGDNSRIIITGDLDQFDRGYEDNGLKDFIDRYMKRYIPSSITICQFSEQDIERHPAISEILEIYS